MLPKVGLCILMYSAVQSFESLSVTEYSLLFNIFAF